MFVQDAAAFAAGLAIEEPLCPLPILSATRLFWVAEPILVPQDWLERHSAPLPLDALPLPTVNEAPFLFGTLH
jgi:hypothetical protein